MSATGSPERSGGGLSEQNKEGSEEAVEFGNICVDVAPLSEDYEKLFSLRVKEKMNERDVTIRDVREMVSQE